MDERYREEASRVGEGVHTPHEQLYKEVDEIVTQYRAEAEEYALLSPEEQSAVKIEKEQERNKRQDIYQHAPSLSEAEQGTVNDFAEEDWRSDVFVVAEKYDKFLIEKLHMTLGAYMESKKERNIAYIDKCLQEEHYAWKVTDEAIGRMKDNTVTRGTPAEA